MGQHRRQFLPEFKADAVALARSSGRPISAIAQAGEPVALRDGQDKVLLGEPLDAVPGPQAGVLRADTLD